MATAEDQSNVGSNLRQAIKAAEEFEQKHYTTDSKGQAEEIDAVDFKSAGNKAAGAISDAATSVKEAVVGPSSPQDGGVSSGTDAAATAAAHKPVANSPAEEQKGFFAMAKDAGALVADKFLPTAHAVGERSPGQKWEDAKGEAREGGRELNQAARDAASALGDKTQYAANRTAEETRNAADRTAEETRRAANRTGEKAQNAADRTDGAIRGGAQEIGDLSRNAADRVQHDWRDVKEGTRDQLADASATRRYEAQHAPPKEEGGIIQSVTNAIRSVLPGGHPQDSAQQTADQAKAKADSASDTLSAKTQEAKNEAWGYKEKTKDEANRLGDEVKETYQEAKNTVHEKTQAAEDYLTADLRPHDEVEAATSHGDIPSNTQDVTAGTAEPSAAVRP